MSSPIRLLIINPNCSSEVTDGLRSIFQHGLPANTQLDFFNPTSGAPQIFDPATAESSSEACIDELVKSPTPAVDITSYDGVLVSCFSDHPLKTALEEHFDRVGAKTMVTTMLDASIAASLVFGGKFGVLTTGTEDLLGLADAVGKMCGAKGGSARMTSVKLSGLGVLELRTGDQVKVEKQFKDSAKELLEQGSKTIILGCAGMSGMNPWVEQAAAELAKNVRVVDGSKAGVELLVGLIRMSRG
jgi:Asp/Glu/hydantoin racemase